MNGFRFAAPAAALALATMVWPAAPQRQPGSVELSAVRFFRSGQGTLIDGFCRVPFALLTALPSGGGAYRVEVNVVDSSGTVLEDDSWPETVSAGVLSMIGGSAVEHFAFAAKEGTYKVNVSITDSASGAVSTASTDVSTYRNRPLASDVLLTEQLRPGAPGDTVPRPGEIRKGHWFITSASHPVLTPQAAKLYYYLEAYPETAGEVHTTAHVVSQGGREIVASAPDSTPLAAGGGIIAGGLDLTGLPPGEYTLRIDVANSDTSVTRSAGFTMGSFATAAAVNESRGKSSAGDEAFATMTGNQLDSLYAPLVYIQDPSERGLWDGLSHDGKVNYLRQFWEKRDPTPGTADNERESSYYKAVADANRRFAEGGAGRIPGWRTDRGRIFLEYGEPDQVLSRPMAAGGEPYEVWKYTRGRARKYLFADRTGFGHYELIYTNDTHESSLPNWQDIIGPQAAQDVESF